MEEPFQEASLQRRHSVLEEPFQEGVQQRPSSRSLTSYQGEQPHTKTRWSSLGPKTIAVVVVVGSVVAVVDTGGGVAVVDTDGVVDDGTDHSVAGDKRVAKGDPGQEAREGEGQAHPLGVGEVGAAHSHP